jgi:hypothetical protein
MRKLTLFGCVLSAMATLVTAQEPSWNAAAIKESDRACLVGILDGYMNAIAKRDPKAVPPLAADVRMTENTGQMDVGEGLLWRSKTEPTPFKIFAFMKRIRPRRALILDEQKQTVGTFPLVVHDGTRRGATPEDPPGMLQNLVTMETFSVRGGQIHHVEAAPCVTIPYGLGNGWTPGSGR